MINGSEFIEIEASGGSSGVLETGLKELGYDEETIGEYLDIIRGDFTHSKEMAEAPSEQYAFIDASYGDSVKTDGSLLLKNKRNLRVLPPLKFAASNMKEVCFGDVSLLYIPSISSSAPTVNMERAFGECYCLRKIGKLDLKPTSLSQTFSLCICLQTIPEIDTSKVTNAELCFYYGVKLTSLPIMNMSSLTNAREMFFNCRKLTTLGGFTGLKTSLSLSASPLLTHDSLLNVLNGLATVTSATTLTLGATNLAKLTDEEKAIALNKGWTLA